MLETKKVRTAGSTFSTNSSYDNYNRLQVLSYPSWSTNPSADDIVVKHEYQKGSLVKLTDTKTHKVYQQVQAVNARGQATMNFGVSSCFLLFSFGALELSDVAI